MAAGAATCPSLGSTGAGSATAAARECKPCLAKHLVSEACRPTAYTEHLTCSTSEAITHETVITIHRRLSPRTTLLHVSRSCRAPAEEDSAGKASSSSRSSSGNSDGDSNGKGSSDSGNTRAKPLPALSEQVMQFGSSSSSSSSGSSSSDSSSEGDISLSGAAAAGHLYPLSAVGGLNLLYFELAMVVILSGALPIVYVRKRRYAR
uniref:Uncharacterized protein n=1 Tax=Tetradesmus obliquus TaxID=3088 RepID=A0A383WPY6_TETOB|eukprot:jgi/Sobl393_1/4622/SZX79249.1